MVIGSPGGPKIISSIATVIVRTLLFDESLTAAVAAPRFHQQWQPAVTEFEAGFSPELLEALKRRGQGVHTSDKTFGRIQAIRVAPDGLVEGVSDPRGTGSAVPVKRK